MSSTSRRSWGKSKKKQAQEKRKLNRRIPIEEEDDVSAELLREHVSEVLSDRVPGGQGWPIEGFHLLSRGLLQVRYMRHQADPEDLLQQPAHDQR